jgi:hypothetical protein
VSDPSSPDLDDDDEVTDEYAPVRPASVVYSPVVYQHLAPACQFVLTMALQEAGATQIVIHPDGAAITCPATAVEDVIDVLSIALRLPVDKPPTQN